MDAGNGTGGAVAVPIMEEMGMEVTPLFCEMDGRFPHHFPDPTVEANLEAAESGGARNAGRSGHRL